MPDILDNPLDGRCSHEISQAVARDMLAALRLAAVEIQQDLESLIRTEAGGTTNWTITDPLPPDEAFDGDPGIPELVRDKHVALTAVVAAIAKGEGR
ncbi:hypothetical protein KPL78_19290 [Roseomonas sp. HJA6]|uniref:Uncharacterized protein n=1 Tax=Roseomonas alba TaxID=2846776 RepID=A0ABS7ACI7_9PROT|nr:hypothetical protein [Neoroseomonas alba]MBW6400014.1 hypothetical protein [Neoroseomonas alba]